MSGSQVVPHLLVVTLQTPHFCLTFLGACFLGSLLIPGVTQTGAALPGFIPGGFPFLLVFWSPEVCKYFFLFLSVVAFKYCIVKYVQERELSSM